MSDAAAHPAKAPRPVSLAPDLFEKALSLGAALMFAAVITALVRGRAEWGLVPASVWVHLATIIVALGLTPVMLLRRRGDARHRQLGWVWAAAMIATALDSLVIRQINHGEFSIIHALSIFTLAQVPVIVWSARRHNVARHRSGVRGMVLGALLIAGFFTFPFGRMLGAWLFG